MDITPYVDSVRHDLVAAAAVAGEQGRDVADRLLLALEPAVRLALMEAISEAAAEITAEMSDGDVEVRLDGRDLAFVVEPGIPATAMPDASGPEPDEDGEVARVTLRVPEGLKTRAEDRAAKTGQSLNTWLVYAIRAATHRPSLGDDPMGVYRSGGRHARHVRGWL